MIDAYTNVVRAQTTPLPLKETKAINHGAEFFSKRLIASLEAIEIGHLVFCVGFESLADLIPANVWPVQL